MAWNTPTDWDYKEAPGSTKLNAQIRDNMSYLKTSLPAGVMMDYAGSSAPEQWLLCNGAAISRSTYSDLYAAIGVAFGAGDGTTTFNLPDCRGRATVGAGTGTSLTARVLAAIFGTETHTLSAAEMPVHTHTQDAHAHAITDPTHSHTPSVNDGASGNTRIRGGGPDNMYNAGTISSSATGISINNATATNQNAGSGSAHANTQPSIVVNKIIKF